MGAKEEKTGIRPQLLNSAAASVFFGIPVTLLILFLAAILLSADKLPAGLSDELTAAAALIGAAAAGARAARQGRGVLSCGLFSSLIYLAILFFIAALVPGGSFAGGITPLIAVIVLIGGILGALLRSGKKSKSKSWRSKYYK
jgi:ABC-type transport system involved in cytochrome c biogenesis permease subunit